MVSPLCAFAAVRQSWRKPVIFGRHLSESSPLRDRPTCLAGPRPWAGQAARRVRNVATLQWEPSAMGHPGINVHARALAMECSNRGQVIWLAMMGKRAQVQPHEPGE